MTRAPSPFRPLRWLAYLPLLLLPLLAAVAIEQPRLAAALQERATAALAEAGFDWARVRISGRDAEISGTAPDRAAATAAAAVVAPLFGVRRVTSRVVTMGP